MKIIDRIARRFTVQVSDQAKTEAKKTALDLLPVAFGIVSAIIGVVIFRGTITEDEETVCLPAVSNTRITTNNYFIGEISEETILKIIDDEEN